MGVMAGTLDLIQRGFVGTEIRDDVLYFNPKLTDHLDGLKFRMRFRGTPMAIELKGGKLTVTPQPGGAHSIRIGVGEQVVDVGVGESQTFTL
jgi:trehalose/maltose hydrolase-like predicted phosphorylase